MEKREFRVITSRSPIEKRDILSWSDVRDPSPRGELVWRKPDELILCCVGGVPTSRVGILAHNLRMNDS
jgi:hypothetical protein